MNRRKFLTMFAAGSAGMTVGDKLGLWDDMHKWLLSPKNIFIPPPAKVTWEVISPLLYTFQLQFEENSAGLWYAK